MSEPINHDESAGDFRAACAGKKPACTPRPSLSTGGAGVDRGERPGRHRAGALAEIAANRRAAVDPVASALPRLGQTRFGSRRQRRATWLSSALRVFPSAEGRIGTPIQLDRGAARGWPVDAVDLGNVPQIVAPSGPVGLPNIQGLIKYRYAMKAMAIMGYTAVGIGENEASMPLTKTLDEYALNNEKPHMVCANLKDRDAKYPGETAAWQLAMPIKGSDVTLGVTALVGPLEREQIKKKDPSVRLDRLDAGPQSRNQRNERGESGLACAALHGFDQPRIARFAGGSGCVRRRFRSFR